MTCEKASNSTITYLSLLGSPNVLVVFVEVGVTNCDCAFSTVLLVLMANTPPLDCEINRHSIIIGTDHTFFIQHHI